MLKYVLVCLLTFFCCTLWWVYADTLLDTYISAIETKQTTLSSQEQSVFLKKTFALLSLQAVRFRYDTEQIAFVAPLQEYLLNKISLPQKNISIKEIPTEEVKVVDLLSLEIPNVDMEQVRSTWLERHNQERASLWLDPLAYHLALESTATTRAKYLGTLRTTTHKRTSSDGYYSYSSIKQWFLNQWIVFAHEEQKGQSLFTENLWWNVYTCKKTDCTKEFIAAIKKSRVFFMSEKWKSSRPHYNAIVGNYTSLWLGVAISGTRYYLVSHYTQSLQ